MRIDRQQFVQELLLREQIRKAIKIVKSQNIKKNLSVLNEEIRLRNVIRTLLKEAEVDDIAASDESTAIVKLRELLKVIVPEYEEGYKSLRTGNEQRESYRSHILNAIQDIIVRGDVNYRAKADEEDVTAVPSEDIGELEEEISVSVGDDDQGREKFLQGVREKPEEVEEEPEDAEDKELSDFTMAGKDKTGAAEAHASMKQTEKQITQAYGRLYDAGDRDIFADYLITNLQLHFDDFEEEMQQILPEPENPEYERLKAAELASVGAEEETGLMDEDEDPFLG